MAASTHKLKANRLSTHKSLSSLVDTTRNVGIEIEVENISRTAVHREVSSMWEVVGDGSLRPVEESAEVRSRGKGYHGADLLKSLDIIRRSKELSRGHYGWRAAVHVHVDMRDKTPEQIKTIMVFYALLEPYMFAFDGTGRQESRFCMPWWVCSQDMIVASSLASTESASQFTRLISMFSKYTALNIAPLHNLGTIEFRHLQSTNNVDRLLEYINICLDIVDISNKATKIAPIDLVLEFMTTPHEAFLQNWLTFGTAKSLLNAECNYSLLSDSVFNRSTNTAISLAETGAIASLSMPKNRDVEIISRLMRGR